MQGFCGCGFARSAGACLLLLWCANACLFGQRLVKSDFRAASGYTFFAPVGSPTSYLIDNEGKTVHTWPGDGIAALAVYLLPNGHIMRTGTAPTTVFGNATGGRVDEWTADGELVWSYTLSTDKYLRHHDIECLENGNVLVIAQELKTFDEAVAAGRDPSRIAGGAIWSEAIFEVRPIRPLGGEIVWEWHAWDHLVQDFGASLNNYGDVAAHPELADINFGQTPDWLHFNAVAYNQELEQIAISSRMLSEIWVIDHSTTAEEATGHSGGNSGKGGDILYRWGNPQTYRAGSASDQRLFDQHGVNWIESGLPGAGNFLVYNNGSQRGFSTVDEIVPPIDEKGNYERAAGRAFGPDKAVWSYGADVDPLFLSRTFGGAQRLPNGNTLICISNANRITEVTPEAEVVWEVDISGLVLPNGSGGTFRATRFPVNYEAMRELGLFRPAPTLVSAASQMGGASAPAALLTAWGEELSSTDGPDVEVTDSSGTRRAAELLFVSPGQINFQMPPEAAIGPARVAIRNGTSEQSADVRIDGVAPALFSANGDGKGVGAILAVRVNRSGESVEPLFTYNNEMEQFVERPLSLGRYESVFLLLLGTGIRGAEASGDLEVSIGEVPVPVVGVAASPELTGLDQVKVGPLPARLAGSGEQPIVLKVTGKAANRVAVWFQ